MHDKLPAVSTTKIDVREKVIGVSTEGGQVALLRAHGKLILLLLVQVSILDCRGLCIFLSELIKQSVCNYIVKYKADKSAII
jgi:hypothetical protein